MKNFAKNIYPDFTYCFFLCAIFLLVSCDNSLDPLEEEKGLYSIYGGLNVRAEENYIRVKNLNKPFNRTAGDSLDAEVRLKNLAADSTEKLGFQTVTFDGIKTFNYRATMDIDFNTRYQIIVEKPDGRKVTATAETPAWADTTVRPAPEERLCSTQMTITFNPVEPGEVIFIKIGFEFKENTFWREDLVALRNGNTNITRLTYDLPSVIANRLDPDIPHYKSICDFVTSDVVTIHYRHLGKGHLVNTSTDSLNLPDEAKNLVGYYENTFEYKFKTLSY